MIDANRVVNTHDILLLTLDTLRHDVARECLRRGDTPNLARLLPGGAWEERHSPGSFTFAAHAAFFAGFLPTPAHPCRPSLSGRHGPARRASRAVQMLHRSRRLHGHPRLFALRFPGSETTTERTCVLDAPDIVTGLAGRGYHTLCVGGVGFFNLQSPLGRVLPGLFAESAWRPEFGVTDPDSTANQVAYTLRRLEELPPGRRLFLFLNVSALHQPNCFYLPGATEDSPASQAAALAYVDRQLPPLFAALQRRGPVLAVVCSDHGTAYGEDGYRGHRLAHPVVWTVPYAEFLLPQVSP
jgi:hypothetical protein